MKRLVAFLLLIPAIALAQVTTNPGVTGVPAPQSAVAITGGTINGTTIGATTPAAGTFTTVTSTGLADLSGAAAGQIKFPATQNSSADLNTLDDYDEYIAADTACTGAITASAIWKLTKVGKVVTLTLPGVQGAGVAAAGIVFGVALPAKYRPTASLMFVSIPLTDNAAALATPGALFINSSTGVMTVFKDGTATGNFTVTANAGLTYATSVSWTQ